jgi:hypothetical protein
MTLLPKILLISILVWIRHLVLEHLDELVEDDGNDSANTRSNPCANALATISGHPASQNGSENAYSKSSVPDQTRR